jgi:hypothetical protein
MAQEAALWLLLQERLAAWGLVVGNVSFRSHTHR